jgi:pyridoxal phosphate-dependent aminotransferase EpsN
MKSAPEDKLIPSEVALDRIHLSIPHMGGLEERFVREAFESNWIAPLGPQVEAFEREFRERVGAPYGVALSTGTAALHLAFKLVGVGPGDEVLVSTLTFSATVNPIIYLGARPVFIDSERESWNLDPAIVERVLEARRKAGRLPKAIAVVHLYGQPADLDVLGELSRHYGVPLVEDAAESLGSSHRGRSPGTFGTFGVYSFNGNKVITTSGGGMLVSPNEDLVQHALKLATQAREPAPHYEHEEVGYNYRMSNVLAAIGRGQLRVLNDHVEARRRNFEFYEQALSDLTGLKFMPEAPWGRHSRWLTTLTIDPREFGADRETVRLALESQNIEARPVWKPMHRQPVFLEYETSGGEVADWLFEHGLCLPSSSSLSTEDLERVVEVVRRTAGKNRRRASRPETRIV